PKEAAPENCTAKGSTMSLFDKQGKIATEEEISAIPAEPVATRNMAGITCTGKESPMQQK
ncbi:hypothetical protein C6495_14035, partial [Candidatus Poribacteria bacterium]